MGERVSRLELAIDRAIESASPEKKAVIEALQALRGVAKVTAATIVTEVGTFQRFRKASELMGYTGLVPSEYSSGSREAKGRITRTGNAHLRHVLGEAAWNARHRPWVSTRLKKVLPTLPSDVTAIAMKAQERLHRKFTKLTFQRKPAGKVATAVARELVGFIWAIGRLVESRPIVSPSAKSGVVHAGDCRSVLGDVRGALEDSLAAPPLTSPARRARKQVREQGPRPTAS